MKKARLWMAAGMLAVLAAGCAKPSTSGMTVGVDTDEYGGQQEMMRVDDKKVARNVVVSEVVVGETKNGLMKVNVKLSSKLNKTYTAQTKFAWFDEAGMEIDPEGDSWRPLTLQGKETKTIQGVAPNASATAFRLRIREGERTRWIIK